MTADKPLVRVSPADAEDWAPQFPATSELVSGHDAKFVDSESLDARAFAELERCKQPWS